MLPRYTHPILRKAEETAEKGSTEDVYSILRGLPLADFCTLHLGVPAEFGRLRSVVPIMPAVDVQKKWVGDSGFPLMRRSCGLVRLFETMTFRATGSGPQGRRILDYGCGWGRLLRLANYFSPIECIHGVDVMQSSLDECKKAGIRNRIELIPPTPVELPFADGMFDVVFSFSVFTHIPAHVAKAVLLAARRKIAEDGVMIITIRSIEFWRLRMDKWPERMVLKMERDHDADGYAFQTFDAQEVNADYGDTTMSFAFLEQLAGECGWKMSAIDRDLSEPFQIAVALTPA